MEIPLNLPSKCLPYVGIDKSKLTIRPFKGKDEKLISEMSGDNFEKKFLTVLKNVVQGIEVEKLTLGDRLYITIWEAINSYSPEFTLKHTCDTCWQMSEFPVNLNDLEIIELPDTYAQPYSLKLPVSGDTVNIRLLTVEDTIKLDELSKTIGNTWLHRFAITLNMPNLNIMQKVEYLENLSTKDLAEIRVFQDKFAHGPKMELKYECPKCGGVGIMPIPFRIEMLFPYGDALTRNFGKAI